MRSAGKLAVQPRGPIRRCAIYTRKSSEEGLEQAFNSLHAQREACDAYIRSQRHEGWVALPTAYDDGGISGGTLDRPALQELLTDIAARRIDLVVVYKVDRLTRSLADFAKIVDVFDAHGASFVSVTQQFNTTTSMGRLTLNMLLSFAQFEREVTGERIRDKIAASKRKGMWMGGSVPLGYEVQDRKLVIIPQEAQAVRDIFSRYQQLGSVRLLQAHLHEAGIRSKLRPTAEAAKMRGGRAFSRGALYLILQNPTYRGEIKHKEAVYPGEHAAIIDLECWNAVQQRLAENRAEDRAQGRALAPSLLAGLVYDDRGERLIPTHATKRGRRYRYYISKRLVTGPAADGAGLRLPARDLEQLVWDRLAQFLSDQTALLLALSPCASDGSQQQALLRHATKLVGSWPERPAAERRALLRSLLMSITVHTHQLEVRLLPHQLAAVLTNRPPTIPDAGEPIVLTVATASKRSGLELRLVVHGAEGQAKPNPGLIRLLARAQQLKDMMLQEDIGIGEVAARAGVTGSYLVRLVRLAFLAPHIKASILEGRQPVELTANTLLLDSRIPLSWAEQRIVLGFN